jgi:alkylation response protein AidB-like acyl-CoA dehydrogenase
MPVATAATRTPQHQALMQAAARAGLALADRSREFEAQRALPQEVADMLADAGLYRLLTPQALGGHEAPPASFYLVVEQLAHADAAAAWCCFISCTSALLAAYLPEETAATLFQRPDLKLAGVFAPRGRAVPAEQHGVAGLRVSGRWAWGSGSRNADLVSAGCLLIGADGQPALMPDGSPRVLSVLLDRSQVHLADNWDAFGLCGTGSGEFEVKDAFVPLARTACLLDGPRLQTPLYRFPVFGLLAIAIAAVATGVARAALLHFIEEASRACRRPAPGRWARAPPCRTPWPGPRRSCNRPAATCWPAWTPPGKAAQQPGELPLAVRRDLRLAATHAVHTSAELVARLYTLAGGGAVFASSPLQRALRNVQVATQHMMVGDATFELTGRLLLGVPTPTPML